MKTEIIQPPIAISALSSPIRSDVPPIIRVPLPSIPLPSISLTPYIVSTPSYLTSEAERRPIKRIVISRSPTRDTNITKPLPLIPSEVITSFPISSNDGLVKLPHTPSIVQPVQRPPLKIMTDSAALALAYNPRQNILNILLEIDETKLISGRSSGANTYSLFELKDFAKRLGLKSSVSKDKLISDIKQLINDYRSDLKRTPKS